MSTNYYAEINVCPHCMVPREIIHIGKRVGLSEGRTSFIFRSNPDHYPNDASKVTAFLLNLGPENKNGIINVKDDGGVNVSIEEWNQILADRTPESDRWNDYEFS